MCQAIWQIKANPEISAGYLHALFSGCPTTVRMRNMEGASELRICVSGCYDTAEDRIEHYCRCRSVWKSVEAPPPEGAAVVHKFEGIGGFFGMCKRMTAQE